MDPRLFSSRTVFSNCGWPLSSAGTISTLFTAARTIPGKSSFLLAGVPRSARIVLQMLSRNSLAVPMYGV